MNHQRHLILLAILLSIISSTQGHGIQHRVYRRSKNKSLLYPVSHPFHRHLDHHLHPLGSGSSGSGSSGNGTSGGSTVTATIGSNVGRIWEVTSAIPLESNSTNTTITNSTITNTTNTNNTSDNTTTTVSNVTNENTTSHNTSTSHNTNSSSSNNNSNTYQPIRITSLLSQSSGGSLLTSTQRQILLQDILTPALQGLSSALSIIPLTGNVLIDEDQLVDGVSCGPGLDSGYPSVVIPSDHFDNGVEGSDLVVYVSVSLVDYPTTDDDIEIEGFTTSEEEEDSVGVKEGEEHMTVEKEDVEDIVIVEDEDALTNISSTVHITGLPSKEDVWQDTKTSQDYSIPNHPNHHHDNQEEEESYFDSNHVPISSSSSTNSCPDPSVLASATYCNTDQFDRPIAGTLHYCINPLTFFNKTNLEQNIMISMHELLHVLGMNLQSLAHFRSATGEPMTERDENGNVKDVEVECTGVKEERGRMVLPLPGEGVLRFRDVRGGVRVAEVVTETVRRVARNQFDCQSLPGAELESNPPSFPETTKTPSSSSSSDVQQEDPNPPLSTNNICIGSHWSRRLFKTDIMNPIVDDAPKSLYISPLTLSYFQDSGWYQINPARSSHVNGWGRGAGCEFVNDACVQKTDGVVPETNVPFFCNQLDEVGGEEDGNRQVSVHGCTDDFSRKAMCDIMDYDSLSPSNTPLSDDPAVMSYDSSHLSSSTLLPFEYEYFSSTYGPSFGGADADLEFCPIFTGFANGLCTSPTTSQSMKFHKMEEFSQNSRCIVSTISKQQTALCIPIACVVSDHSLRVKVDGEWKKCDKAGQKIDLWWDDSDYVICPDPWRTCPTFFCPRNCLEHKDGICNYDTGDCVCGAASSSSSSSSSLEEEHDVNDNLNYWVGKNVSMKCENILGLVASDGMERIETSLSQYYVANSTVLVSQGKTIFNKTHRIFKKMSVGEIAAFCIGGSMVFFLLTILYKKFFFLKLRERTRETRRARKDKLIAAMLVRLRMEDPRNNSTGDEFDERLGRRRSDFLESGKVEGEKNVNLMVVEPPPLHLSMGAVSQKNVSSLWDQNDVVRDRDLNHNSDCEVESKHYNENATSRLGEIVGVTASSAAEYGLSRRRL